MRLLIAALVLFTSFPLFSQLPDIEWQFSRDIENIDYVTSAIETQDGGYLIVGERADYYEYDAMGFARQYAIKLSSSGQMQWELDLGTPTYDPHINPNYGINAILPIELKNNGGFIVKRSLGTVLKISSSGVSGATYNTPDQLVDIEYFDDQIVVLLSTKLVTLNTNLVQTAIRDISSLGDPVDLAIDLNNQGVVIGSNNGTVGKISCVNLAGTVVLWSQNLTGQVEQLRPFVSRFENSNADNSSFNIVNSLNLSRNFGVDDYLVIGKLAGKPWLRVGTLYGAQITKTYNNPIVSVVTTDDGRIIVSRTDSLAVLKSDLSTIWKTTDLKNLGIYLKSDGSILSFGGQDFRVVKTEPTVLSNAQIFSITGIDTPGYDFDGGFGGGLRGLDFNRSQFFDYNKDGILDYYQLSNNLSYWSADLTNYTSKTLNALLSQSASKFSVLNTKLNSSVQWDNYDPYNFYLNDLDNDGNNELFNNKLNNIDPTTGVQSEQATNLAVFDKPSQTNTSLADFDNNGLVDVFRNKDAIYLQGPVNSFTKVASSTSFAGTISSPIPIDINNDGWIDLVDVAGKSIYLNQNLVFTKHATAFTHTPLFPIELNGDNFIDFIAYTGNTYYTCINSGTLTFTYKVLNLPSPIHVVGDINNDGKSDLSGGNSVYFNDGLGNFANIFSLDYFLPGLDKIKSISPGNFDNDGDLDLAVSDSYQTVFVRNNQTIINQKPTSPTNLRSNRASNIVTLEWNAATDNNTPAASLTYNVYIKNGAQIIASANSLTNGQRTLVNVGNAGLAKIFKIINLPVGTYTWSVQSIDKSFEPSAFAAEQTLYITNNPTNIALSNATIVENSAATIGTLTTTDPDAGETFSYSLVAGTGSTDNALFKITGNALSALVAGSLNFETKPSYSIRIRTTDNRQGFFEKVFTITVTNVQEAASNIFLSAASIEENKPIGTEIATITNNDPDAGDVHLFTLVAGTGDTDNSQFEIVGNKLKSKAIFNYEVKSSYSIRVRTNDQQGQTFEKAFSISIIDLNDLTKPVLNLPSLISQTGFTLSWPIVEGASTYELEISTGNFSDFITDYNPKVISGTSAIVTGLTPGIIYKIRARAVHLTFKSPNSDEIAQITKPANPLALDPAQIDVTSFKAGWTAPVGTDSYEFELSEGEGVFTTLPDYPKTVTGALDLVVTGLTAKTVYKYRVRAVNTAGASGNSNEKSVETLQVQNSVPLSLSTPIVSGSKISVNVTGGSGTREIKFYSKKITAASNTYVEKELTSATDAHETTVSTDDFDELGLEYYFTALDGSVTTPVETAKGYIYQTVGLNTFSAIPFSTKLNGTAGTYEMFSVPYEITEKSIASNFDELGAPDKTQWRLLRFQGGKYIEYPDNITTIDLGKGYWFNALQKVDIKTGEGKVTSANQTAPFTITFAQGWNQIGNPYPFNIDWETIKTANSAAGLNSLWLFEGGKYVKKDVLATWKGAFVFSDTGGSVSFPVTAKTTSPGRTAKEELTPTLDEAAWQLPIKLSLNGLEQISAIGMHPEARSSKDKFDEITIPRFIDYLEMNTYHEEFFAPHFASDMVPTTDETSWLFTVSSNQKEGVATLTWNQQALHGNQSKIALIDLQEQTLVDMKTTNTYQFNWTEGRQFKILYSREGELLPGVTMLGNAYPNPFTTGTTIPFLLEEDQTRVEISIYDLLGRKVKTLNQQNNKAGIHSMEWNGNNEQGTAVDGGLYLYQLRGDKGILSPPKRLIKN